MTAQNRNGHIGRFDEFMPVRKTTEEVLKEAIAFKNGARAEYKDFEPKLIGRFGSLDLVRYRLNSKCLFDAYLAMGDTRTDPRDELSYADSSARLGVIDRESGEPIAMLWVIGDDDGGFMLALPSFSKKRQANQCDLHAVLRELDIPPSRRNGEDREFVCRFDIWYDEGEWVVKEPVHVIIYTFESVCWNTQPFMCDRSSVYVPLDPAVPFDGGGDAHLAYMAKNHYRGLAETKFWSTPHAVQPGFSSWMGFGEPSLVKVVSPGMYEECSPAADNITGSVPPSP